MKNSELQTVLIFDRIVALMIFKAFSFLCLISAAILCAMLFRDFINSSFSARLIYEKRESIFFIFMLVLFCFLTKKFSELIGKDLDDLKKIPKPGEDNENKNS